MHTKMGPKKLAVAGLVFLAVLLVAPPAYAFEARSGDTVVIEADEVVDDDLYVFAGTFTLDGMVTGDVIAVGGQITINGEVGGDLIAAGQSILIDGEVADDARIAGYTLTLGGRAQLGDDLVAAGYSLENQSGSTTGGDLIFAGYQTLLAGEVNGDANIEGGAVKIIGTIRGNVDVDVDGADEEAAPPTSFMPYFPTVPFVPTGLTIDESALIGGNLEYTSSTEVDIPAEVVVGQTTFHQYVPVAKEKPVSPAMRFLNGFLDQLRRLAALLIVGLGIVWIAPRWTRRAAHAIQARPLPSLGWGIVLSAVIVLGLLVVLVMTVILAIILGVVTLGNLIGWVVSGGLLATSLVLFLFIFSLSFLTETLVSYAGGQLILRGIKPGWVDSRIWPLVIGLIVFVILTAIPYLKIIVYIGVILLGLGAIWTLGREAWRQRRAVA